MLKFLRVCYFSFLALIGICGSIALGNYALTQGSGTNFGSVIIGGVHYAQMLICDLNTPGQCATISSGGAVKVDGSATTQPVSASSLPLPTGAATDAALVSIDTTLGSPMQNSGGSVTANAGTNLNTSLLALETGGNLATISSDIGPPGSTVCATDTSSCNTNQQMQRLAQRLTTISTALGSPFQAGASISNTVFGATQSGTWTIQPGNTANTVPWLVSASQSGTWNINNITGTVPLPTGASTSAKQPALGIAGTASTDVLTVQGIASMTPFLVNLSGTNNINNVSGTISLPTGASTSANQTSGNQKTQIVDGSGNVIASTSNNLNVQCANCSGSGAVATDEASFTAGTSILAPTGGFFQTTPTSNPLTTGQQGMFQVTANRALFSNLRNASGTEVGTFGSPLRVDTTGTTTQPISGTITATQSTGSNLHVVCDSGCSGAGGGTSSNFAATFPTAGTAIGLANGGNMVSAKADASGNLLTALGVALPSGTNAIGSITNTSFAATQSGTWNIGSITTLPALPANQSTNEAQINGVTPLMGNGVTGTGSQRVTIASDNTAFPVNATLQASSATAIGTVNPTTAANWGVGATGSVVPANAVLTGSNVGGNTTANVGCNSSVIYDASTSGSTELVSLTSSQSIRVCGYTIFSSGTANVSLVYGTGTNCATGSTKITPAYQLIAQTGISDQSPIWRGLTTIASNALCINSSAAVAVQAMVYYEKH